MVDGSKRNFSSAAFFLPSSALFKLTCTHPFILKTPKPKEHNWRLSRALKGINFTTLSQNAKCPLSASS